MILQERQKLPFIHFGFGRQSITAYVGEVITIWQDNIFNNEFYTPEISSSGNTVVSISLNKAEVTYDTLGSKTLRYSNSLNLKKLVSNALTINIIEITADAKDIKRAV